MMLNAESTDRMNSQEQTEAKLECWGQGKLECKGQAWCYWQRKSGEAKRRISWERGKKVQFWYLILYKSTNNINMHKKS